MIPRFPTIAFLHHTAGGNLGDDATIAAIVHNIKARWPEAKIVGLPLVHEDPVRAMEFPFSHRIFDTPPSVRTTANLKAKIKAVVRNNRVLSSLLRRLYTLANTAPKAVFREVPFLVSSFLRLRSIDLLIISVGGQFAELSGRPRAFQYCPWKYSYTISKWALLAKLAKVKLIMLNVAAGPHGGVLDKLFFRQAIISASYVSFREETSRELAHSRGICGESHVLPDTGYTTNVFAVSAARLGGRRRTMVGLGPMLFGDPGSSPQNESLFNSYLLQLSQFTLWLLKNDYHVRLFCTDISVDPAALCGLTKVVRVDLGYGESEECFDRVHQWSCDELLANMSTMDYVVTSRFHGALFAQMLNIPVLTVPHDPCVSALMHKCRDFRGIVSTPTNAIRNSWSRYLHLW